MGVLVAFGVVAAFCIFRWMMKWRQSANSVSGERNIIKYFRGQYLDTQKCKLTWSHCDTVGETFSFHLAFFFSNGERYPITLDEIAIDVRFSDAKVSHITDVQEADNGECPNILKASFAVRRSGEYKISIRHLGRHILNSPYRREFEPGSLSSDQTVLLRTTHSLLSVVTMTEEKNHQMEIIPRDTFDNNCCQVLNEQDFDATFDLTLAEINSMDYNPPFVWDVVKKYSSQRLILNFTVYQAGCYKAELTYNDRPIKNGVFDVIVLTDDETLEVKQNINKKNLHVWFECRLLPSECIVEQSVEPPQRSRGMSTGDFSPPKSPVKRKRLQSLGQPSNKLKKVYCYITPKQLIIREYFLKIFFRRMYTFRVSPCTQLICSENDEHSGLPVLIVDDGFHTKLCLICARRNILAATFVGILYSNMGRSESYDEKVKHFQSQILKHHQMSVMSQDKIELTIDRNDILNSSYKATKDLSTSSWVKRFVIHFKHEEGLDWGGLNREWVHLLCKAIFQPRECEAGDRTADNGSGMFRSLKDDPQALVLPQTHVKSGFKLKYYEMAGRLVGKCLIQTALGGESTRQVTARFARSFLSQTVGLPVTYHHFESDDPDLFTSKVRFILDNDITEDAEITFSEEEYSSDGKLAKVVNLVPNGANIAVTNENKHKYLDRIAQYRLHEVVKPEIDSFLKGLNSLIPDEMLGAFDENEVELLMCGSSKISVEDMKIHCIVNGHLGKMLEWFWALASSFTQAELARLLQFTTGCSHLPPDGFKSLEPRFKISFMPFNEGSLPTAHTCFNELCLPHYDSYEEMHRMLKIAITEGATGFGLV